MKNEISYLNTAELSDFVTIYYRESLHQTISNQVATTIAIIFEAFTQLAQQSGPSNVTINALTKKAGFSRTTFYKYFASIPQLVHQLQEIILFHLDYYSTSYYHFYTQSDLKSFEQAEKDATSMMRYFGLFIHDQKFVDQLRQALRLLFERPLPSFNSPSKDKQYLFKYMKECFLAYSSDIILYYYFQKEKISLEEHLHYAQIISHELMQIFDKIKRM